jgi:hypothetical protein
MSFFDSFQPFGRFQPSEYTYNPYQENHQRPRGNRRPVQPHPQSRAAYYQHYPQETSRRDPFEYYPQEATQRTALGPVPQGSQRRNLFEQENAVPNRMFYSQQPSYMKPYYNEGSDDEELRQAESLHKHKQRQTHLPPDNQDKRGKPPHQEIKSSQNEGIKTVPIRSVNVPMAQDQRSQPAVSHGEHQQRQHKNIPVNVQQTTEQPRQVDQKHKHLKKDKVAVDRSVLSPSEGDRIIEEIPFDQVKSPEPEKVTAESSPGRVQFVWEDEDDEDDVIETVVECSSPPKKTSSPPAFSSHSVLADRPEEPREPVSIQSLNEEKELTNSDEPDEMFLDDVPESPGNASEDWVHLDSSENHVEEQEEEHEEEQKQHNEVNQHGNSSLEVSEKTETEVSPEDFDENDFEKWSKELEVLQFIGFDDRYTLVRLLNEKIGDPNLEKPIKQKRFQDVLRLLL